MAQTAIPGDAEELPEYPLARQCPHLPPDGLNRLRARAPITRARLAGGRVAWIVTGYPEMRALLTDARLSSNRQHPQFPFVVPVPAFEQLRREQGALTRGALGSTLIGADPPDHSRQRRMLIPHFTVRKIPRPAIERIVDERLDAMSSAGPSVDLVSTFALPVPSMVICELLGVPYEDHEFFEEQARRRLDPGNTDAFGRLHEYLERLVRRKQQRPGAGEPGLLDELLDTHVADGALDLPELVSFALLLLLAGHDTTANMLALSTLTLLAHPEQLAELRAHPDRWPNAVDELLRYVSIVNGSPRVATADIDIGGVLIKAGDGVLLSNGGANHDPNLAAHPEVFDIAREQSHHLAFGYGIHQCLGQNLARAELAIGLRALFTRFPGLRSRAPIGDVPAKQGLLAGLDELWVDW